MQGSFLGEVNGEDVGFLRAIAGPLDAEAEGRKAWIEGFVLAPFDRFAEPGLSQRDAIRAGEAGERTKLFVQELDFELSLIGQAGGVYEDAAWAGRAGA